ncbi:MAG TPA: peptide chain release factor 2 [Candidatus Limnocylindria bacterium]
MTVEELEREYTPLREQALAVRGIFDAPKQKTRLAETENQISSPDFWNQPEKSQKVMQERKRLEDAVANDRRIASMTDDLDTLFELAREGEDVSEEISRELQNYSAHLEKLETAMLLSGENDARSAIVTIHPGAGGTESQDWAEMLLRMYLRWAERHGFKTEILEATEGEEAGLKSVSFSIDGRWAYGRLRSERGVHRLVRISPYDSQKRRHTSFALVEIMPEVPEDAAVEIDEKDLRVDTYRSSGAGGQHVNKTDSAVRLTHLPTGIVVAVQSERSQHQNRERALSVLRAKLIERQEQEREAELARLRGEHVEAGWGNQIRSYVLQPYTMVKDLRTNVETSNPSAVLDGELDPFIEGYLRWRVGEGEPTPAA